MAPSTGSSFLDHFAALRDPRQSWKVVYPLSEVLLTVLSGTIAGAEDFVEIRRWAVLHLDFLRRFLPFASGIPSHDTLNDIMNAIDAELFGACFTQWVASLASRTVCAEAGPEVVAIDGKASRRTHDRARDRNPLHLVSAWASGQRLVLGQQACEAKSNEITAIPLLLDRLAIRGALVTIDAMGCQTKIAECPSGNKVNFLSRLGFLCQRIGGCDDVDEREPPSLRSEQFTLSERPDGRRMGSDCTTDPPCEVWRQQADA